VIYAIIAALVLAALLAVAVKLWSLEKTNHKADIEQFARETEIRNAREKALQGNVAALEAAYGVHQKIDKKEETANEKINETVLSGASSAVTSAGTFVQNAPRRGAGRSAATAPGSGPANP
jgi:predicted Holliday junction resolvase-like endonuclease